MPQPRTTRAKFICQSVTKRKSMLAHGQTGFVYDAQFNVVISGSDENKRFFALTPSGSVTLTTVSEDLFEPGKDYYIDFVPVEPSMEKRQDNLDAEAEELDPNE